MTTMLGASWIPKLAAVLSAMGTAMLGMDQPYAFFGQVMLGIAGLAFWFVRQNNVTSEQAGAKPIEPMTSHRVR